MYTSAAPFNSTRPICIWYLNYLHQKVKEDSFKFKFYFKSSDFYNEQI